MITREELYELVWSTSISAAAKQLEVSDVYLGRVVCRKMDVPRPPRGYRTLRELGRAPDRPALPEWRPGTDRVWSRGGRAKQPRQVRVLLPPTPDPGARRERKGVHPLVADAATHLEGAGPAAGSRYLAPRKKLMADVATSKECRAKCLRFANALFNSIESAGHWVVVAPKFENLIRIEISNKEHHGTLERGDRLPWSPMRPTVAYVFGVPVGLAVVELSERAKMHYAGDGNFLRTGEFRAAEHVGPTWEAVMDVPTGRLKLVAYSPLHGIPWQARWIEEPGKPLEDRLDLIVGDVQCGAIDLAEKLEAAGLYFA